MHVLAPTCHVMHCLAVGLIELLSQTSSELHVCISRQLHAPHTSWFFVGVSSFHRDMYTIGSSVANQMFRQGCRQQNTACPVTLACWHRSCTTLVVLNICSGLIWKHTLSHIQIQ